MFILAVLFLIALFFGLWYVESKVCGLTEKERCFGAKVTGPLMSISASGTIGKSLTFLTWKGIQVCREWFKPANPQSTEQVNVRYAWELLVQSWQNQHISVKEFYNVFAEGTQMSGFNQFMSRGMDQYIIQITAAVTPVSVEVTAVSPPDEVWTWA